MVDIAGNCKRVMDAIADAAERRGRDPRQVRLLAATKTQPVEAVRAAVEAGVSLLGENYVQEAQAKKDLVGGDAEWHLIGHLQRNKARAASEENGPLVRVSRHTIMRPTDYAFTSD